FDALKAIKGNLIDFNGAIGVVPWALFAVGIFRCRDRRARNLCGLMAIAIVLVFLTPAQRFLYHRFLLLGVFTAVIIASAGYDSLEETPLGRRMTIRVFGAFGLAALLLAVGLIMTQRNIATHRDALVGRIQSQVLEGAKTNQFGVYPEW